MAIGMRLNRTFALFLCLITYSLSLVTDCALPQTKNCRSF